MHKALSVTADTIVCVVNDEMPRVVSKDGFGARLLKGHTANVIACDVSVVDSGSQQVGRISLYVSGTRPLADACAF